ncbi:MAG: hypothetical protein ACWGHO_02100 [Candidatus Moraniibacteriota bacterium]
MKFEYAQTEPIEDFSEKTVRNSEVSSIGDEKDVEEKAEVDKELLDEQVDEKPEELSIREFSKRYASLERGEVLNKMRMLRMKHYAGQKPKSSWDQETKLEQEQGMIEAQEKKIAEIEEEIASVSIQLQERKASHWNSFIDYFTKDSKNLAIKIAEHTVKKEELEEDVQERLEIISEIKKDIEDGSYLKESKKILADFYKQQEEKKSVFERQEDVRDIENIFKKYGTVFVHAMAPKASIMVYNAINPEAYKSLETRLDIIAGYQPTLATSAFPVENGVLNTKSGLLANTGVIFKGGRLLDISREDIGSSPRGMYARIPRTDKSKGILREDMESHIETELGGVLSGEVNVYPEAIIENPEIGALFYVAKEETPLLSREEARRKFEEKGEGKTWRQYGGSALFKDDIEALQKMALELGVPLLRISENNSTQLDMQEFFAAPSLSKEKKFDAASRAIEKNPFVINSANRKRFDAIKNGETNKYFSEDSGKLKFYLENIKETRSNIEKKIESLKWEIANSVVSKTVDHLTRYLDSEKMALENQAYELYGVILAADSMGDENTSELAQKALKEIAPQSLGLNPLIFIKEWYENHTDEHGKYKIQENDIPFDVRQRLDILKKT